MRIKRIIIGLNILLQFVIFISDGLSQQDNFIYPIINKSVDYFKEKVNCNGISKHNHVFIVKVLDFNPQKSFIKYSLIDLLDLNNFDKLNLHGYYYFEGDVIIMTQKENTGFFLNDSINLLTNKNSLVSTLQNQHSKFFFVNFYEEGLIDSPTIGVFEFEKSNCKNKLHGKLIANLVYPLINVPISERPIMHYSNTFEYFVDSIGNSDLAPWKECPLKFDERYFKNGVYSEKLKIKVDD